MKTLSIYTISLLFLLTACTNKEKAEAEKNLQAFESYVQELDSNTLNFNLENWEAIETEYETLNSSLDSTKEHLSTTSQDHLEELQNEFAEIQKKYKAAIDNTQSEAKDKMASIEDWMSSTSESFKLNKDTPVGTIETEWKDFQEDFKSNWDDLTEETKEEWNTLENRVNQWIEYELKPNLK